MWKKRRSNFLWIRNLEKSMYRIELVVTRSGEISAYQINNDCYGQDNRAKMNSLLVCMHDHEDERIINDDNRKS
jgi:hypothetical protein